MNRILFEKSEIIDGKAIFGGVRAQHVLEVLHGEVGQRLKTGEVDGAIGSSEIISIDSSAENPEITVAVEHRDVAPEPWLDLILAPPRPRVMKRLLPQLATLGVGKIFLVGAKKVEKDFWGATLLRPENYRPLLVEGLMQSGTTRLPELTTFKSFRAFTRDELPQLTATPRDLIVAHPYATDFAFNAAAANPTARPLLAVGPEGGWTDDEISILKNCGFKGYSLGSRILRTDTALIALLARLGPLYGEI